MGLQRNFFVGRISARSTSHGGGSEGRSGGVCRLAVAAPQMPVGGGEHTNQAPIDTTSDLQELYSMARVPPEGVLKEFGA